MERAFTAHAALPKEDGEEEDEDQAEVLESTISDAVDDAYHINLMELVGEGPDPAHSVPVELTEPQRTFLDRALDLQSCWFKAKLVADQPEGTEAEVALPVTALGKRMEFSTHAPWKYLVEIEKVDKKVEDGLMNIMVDY